MLLVGVSGFFTFFISGNQCLPFFFIIEVIPRFRSCAGGLFFMIDGGFLRRLLRASFCKVA